MGFTLIMFVLVDGYGLTSAIPLLFGTSMLLGVVIVFFMEGKKGDPLYIFTGVAVLFVAVILNTIASKYMSLRQFTYSMNQKCQEKKKSAEKKEEVTVPLTEEPKKLVFPLVHVYSKLSTTTFIILGLSAALCDVFYAPCTAMGNKDPIPLSPYVEQRVRCHVGHFPGCQSRLLRLRLPLRLVLLCLSIDRSIVMRHPLKGNKCTFSDWIHATWKQRWPGRVFFPSLMSSHLVGVPSGARQLGLRVCGLAAGIRDWLRAEPWNAAGVCAARSVRVP